MGSEVERPVTEEMSAEAAFEALGHETRVAILETLGTSEEALSFSALRERVGERDSGQFNYHLDRLRGTFLSQNDDGEYELSFAGSQVVGAVLAGRYTKTGDVTGVPVEGPCPLCGGELRAAYRESTFSIQCVDCEEVVSEYGVPPGVFEPYDVEQYPEVGWRYLTTRMHLFFEGFCPTCAGPVETTVTEIEEGPEYVEASAEWSCQRCGTNMMSTLPAGLLAHDAVRAFAYDHGEDLETAVWTKRWLIEGVGRIEEEEPLRVVIELTLEGERLELVLDGELEVVEERRVEV